jgi:hypothetical protein
VEVEAPSVINIDDDADTDPGGQWHHVLSRCVAKPHDAKAVVERNSDVEVVDDGELANINGIKYNLGRLLGSGGITSSPPSTPSLSGVHTPSSLAPSTSETPAKKYEDEGDDASVVEPGRNVQETLAHADISIICRQTSWRVAP